MQFLLYIISSVIVYSARKFRESKNVTAIRIYPNNNMKRERLTLVSFYKRSRNICDESSLLDTGTRFMKANLRNRADYDETIFLSFSSRCSYARDTRHAGTIVSRQSITVDRIVPFSRNESRNIFK